MSDVITCPSGLRGRVRGMKVREERVLTDRKLAKQGRRIDELLKACWLECRDPGPYSLRDDGTLDWRQVLQGDRFYALLMVRALTYGAEYAFAVNRQNGACRSRIPWELSPQAAAGLTAQAMKGFGLSTEEASLSVDQMLKPLDLFAISAGQLPLALGTAARGAGTLNQSALRDANGPRPRHERHPRRRARLDRRRRSHGAHGRSEGAAGALKPKVWREPIRGGMPRQSVPAGPSGTASAHRGAKGAPELREHRHRISSG